jgi:hypothetical protein
MGLMHWDDPVIQDILDIQDDLTCTTTHHRGAFSWLDDLGPESVVHRQLDSGSYAPGIGWNQ